MNDDEGRGQSAFNKSDRSFRKEIVTFVVLFDLINRNRWTERQTLNCSTRSKHHRQTMNVEEIEVERERERDERSLTDTVCGVLVVDGAKLPQTNGIS
jgi:hypothetical protein